MSAVLWQLLVWPLLAFTGDWTPIRLALLDAAGWVLYVVLLGWWLRRARQQPATSALWLSWLAGVFVAGAVLVGGVLSLKRCSADYTELALVVLVSGGAGGAALWAGGRVGRNLKLGAWLPWVSVLGSTLLVVVIHAFLGVQALAWCGDFGPLELPPTS